MNASTYWPAVQNQVCSSCKDFSKESNCQYDNGSRCALSRSFPRVLNAVQAAMDETDLAAYVLSIRRHVCSECPNQDSRGRCVIRNNQDCALDTRLEIVVNTLKKEIDSAA